MNTKTHIITSAALAGAVYARTHSVPESTTCFLGGFLIDLDHLIDFQLFCPERFSLKTFFSWFLDARWQRILLIFHSYELFGLLLLASVYFDSSILRGLLWGTGLHLVLDQFGNRMKYRISPWFYLLLFRISVGFRRERLISSQP